MATPTKDQIVEYATELFYRDNPDATTPEVYELKESGYYGVAQQELMRGESAEELSYLEKQAGAIGRRVVTEEEQEKLVDLAVGLEKLKEAEKQLKERKARREAPPEVKTHKLRGTLEPMLEAARVKQLDKFEEQGEDWQKIFAQKKKVKGELKELDQQINHRETNGKMQGHKKGKKTNKMSCFAVMNKCLERGLSAKECKSLARPPLCKKAERGARKTKAYHERAHRRMPKPKKQPSLLPSLPGFPTVD